MAESQAPTRIASAEESEGGGSAWSDPPPADAERDPLLGVTLNQTYTLVRLLGTGGMGRVYEATHSRIRNKRYAIKVLHPELAFSAEVRSRFQREAEAAACVQHPNAVGIFDVALTPEGWPYLVCEFLEGRELAAQLKSQGRLSGRQTIDIGVQICRALAEAHRGGVVHRDLKPHNVFLVGDFERAIPEHVLVKVLDFGLSRFLEAGGTELTKTGAILGTPSYMAPEQARGERADHRTDIYGVGAVLYACATGRSPFRGDTPQAVLLAVMSSEPPRPSTLSPFVSQELELVIQRAMARSPSERYPDMDSLREALEQLEDYAPSVADSRSPRRLPSRAMLNDEAPASARLDLATFLLLAGVFLVLAGVAAVAGTVVSWFGEWPLTPMETLLATLVVVGTLLTPGLLLLFRLRKTVWSNTARVVELLAATKRSLGVGLLAYGILAVVLSFWDYAGSRLLGGILPLGGPALSWPGLPATLLFAAGFIVAAEILHSRLVSQGGWVTKLGSESVARRRRWFAGPGIFAAGVFLAATTVVAALASRGDAEEESVKPTQETGRPKLAPKGEPRTKTTGTANSKAEGPLKGSRAGASSEKAEPTGKESEGDPSGDEEAEAAPAAELRQAKSQGTEALALLGARYPKDPVVVRALAVQYAATAATLVQSLDTFSRLFQLDAEAPKDKETRQLVSQMLDIEGPVRKRAFDLLAFEMGNEGTDHLYRLALSEPKHKDEAMRHLAEARKEGTVSEALAIAMDLQFNPSCENRLALLPAAKEHGDERSIQILSALSTARRGCGKRKRDLCKPTCPAQADQFRASIESISQRLLENGKRD